MATSRISGILEQLPSPDKLDFATHQEFVKLYKALHLMIADIAEMQTTLANNIAPDPTTLAEFEVVVGGFPVAADGESVYATVGA